MTRTAEPKLVKFCTHVGYINSSNRMTYRPQKRRGYCHVTVLILSVCRAAARREGLSAEAELLVYKVVLSMFDCDVHLCNLCLVHAHRF